MYPVVFLPRADFFNIAVLCAFANKHMLPVLRDAEKLLKVTFL
jgi:hypothetical protein